MPKLKQKPFTSEDDDARAGCLLNLSAVNFGVPIFTVIDGALSEESLLSYLHTCRLEPRMPLKGDRRLESLIGGDPEPSIAFKGRFLSYSTGESQPGQHGQHTQSASCQVNILYS